MKLWILLQAEGAGGGIMGQVFLFGSIILIMYFFMIRPQQKKQKETKNFLEAMKKGDTVVTIGGIHGKVSSIEGDTVTVDLDKGLKIKVEKSAISADFTKKATGTK
ncbi:Preprotein translocase subunit YajC [Indibacter alkaliphilus LW1]|jgi:preprotein translocase subunit YajC|uniref:Sec translocon accessory complex subunit YajC n=1 Tax=Indibacter alkaliphilus (strain CCUG 57479 / KCTC 22604 / LW1) TaxID=1189612 RepID=S2DM95_INDAL|nr:preprotein translocase subunit YajC [Indibacter alkaliphilus]EPA00073.1 Preprotein translocase subunit YajC [Indibacter alkaliphilus LW1]